MKTIHQEMNKSLEQTNDFSAKRAATLIQRTVRHWLKKFEEDDASFYGEEELPDIVVCDL